MKPDFNISPMTLGTAQIGMDYGIANREGRPDEEQAFRIIDTAIENGVNCLDTAAAYGDSEKIIGKYFRSAKNRREEITIVSKLRLGRIKASETGKTMMKAVEESLKNLKTDCLDILLLHDAKEHKTHGKEIESTFEKLLSSGVIKAAGASCYEFREIEPMLENEIFSAFQMPVNLLDNAIHSTEEADMIRNKLVFARSIFLQGLFFLDPYNLKGNLRDAAPFINMIREIAAEKGISVQELAIKYVRSLGFVDSLVIGAENPVQVTENAKYLKSIIFTHAEADSIRESLSGAPGWITRPYLWNVHG